MEQIATVTEIICRIGGVARLDPDQDFYDAGVTSVQALPLLMELEEKFEVNIPDDRFLTARTPRAMYLVLADLKNS